MQRFFRIFFLVGIFAALRTESETLPDDVDALSDMQRLVSSSNLKLRGWKHGIDPCGEYVPCGINHLPECNWEGIACVTQTGTIHTIAGIEIRGNGSVHQLKGRLPTRLPSNLRSIALPDNALHGNLFDPECEEENTCSDIWSQNEELITVNIEGNDLEGRLPEWKTLHKLENIQLSNNRINGTLPSSWSEKIHLSRIEVSNNRLTGVLPEEWTSLIAVQFIQLAQNTLERQIPASWFHLPALVLLDVSGNCGMCGEVPENYAFAIYGNGTNLNTGCSRCDGCECKRGQLKFVLTNVFLSIMFLFVIFCGCFVWRCLKKEEPTQQLPVTAMMPPMMPRKPQENPTIVINPDQDVCICCPVVKTSRSESDPEEDYTSESISEGDSSEYSSFNDSKSIDPKALAFLYKKSPMLTLAEKAWSEELAGPSEIRPEGYASDLDGRSNSPGIRPRRSKSALEGSSQKKVSRNFIESRKSAKMAVELTPTSRPKNRHRRRRVRTFRRRNRRGLAGDFRISEPQPSIKIPKNLD